MEGKNAIKDSYNYLVKLQRANTTDVVNIDYKKMDQKTKVVLTEAIDCVIKKRKKELEKIIIGIDKYM